jgi:protein-tyrosine phosphatase
MFESILVVCTGNICRTPVAAPPLSEKLGRPVGSAGIDALVGQDIAATARQVAEEHGLICPPHSARKLTRELCCDADLILVMENRQREYVGLLAPEVSGKTFLLGKWTDNSEISDPYRKSRDVYRQVYRLLEKATTSWASKLTRG